MSETQVLNTNRFNITIWGIIAFAFLFIFGGGWLFFSQIAGAVVTNGTIAIHGRSKTVQHLEGGVVTEITVLNGDLVQAGDTVIKLDDKLLKANLNVYTNRLQEAAAVKNRLLAERDELEEVGRSFIILENLGVNINEEVVQAQKKLFKARLRTRTGQKKQILEQIEQFKNQIVGIKAQESSLRLQINLLNEQISGQEKLVSQGFSTATAVRDLKRQHAELNGQLGQVIAGKAQAENSINEAEIQILLGAREFRQDVLSELTRIELEIRDLSQQLQATQTQLQRTEIKAPIDGMVHELAIHTIGGVIANGAPLMQIVPQNEDLDVEIFIEPQFIDDVYIGQPAGIRFSAFNQRKTPELTGSIKTVSPNITTNEEDGSSFYTAKVNVPDYELKRLGNEKLIPGMPVEVFVKTEERSALNYLIKPLFDQINRAFREE